MQVFAWVALVAYWFAWGYPLIFWAAKKQSSDSNGARRAYMHAGFLLEGIAIFLAFALGISPESSVGWARLLPAVTLGTIAVSLSWLSVKYVGKRLRVHADCRLEEIARTGPYSRVRYPICTSLMAILLCTLAILTPWRWAIFPLACFVAGAEICVRAQDRQLVARFGEQFQQYQRRVPAYIPFVR